jgi:class 3 adenylate cyclase
MPRLQARSFTGSGDIREFPNGYTSVLQLDETVVGYGVYEPGWRWSTAMPAIARSATCQLHHVGYAVSGQLHVQTDAGEELDIHGHSVYEIPPGHDAWVVGDAPFVTLDWSSARGWATMVHEGSGDEVVVTVVFTDIVDSTAVLHRLGDEAWRGRLATHHARMREQLNVFRGREVKTTGDGLLAVFDRPIRAVRCAAAMAAVARSLDLPIRVGVHTGEVEISGDDAKGLAIHAAARIMALGGADDVMVSATTRDLLEGSGVVLEDAGEHELKGLPGARRVYRMTTPAAGRS